MPANHAAARRSNALFVAGRAAALTAALIRLRPASKEHRQHK
ncbi:hypothetical protein BSIN_0563 [Burkholderia singularis]|uniref:Uncharacterized protein n=1 Tax=Burkholderia singularis TaxID=1503053 RepID=A0A238H8J1_9BURK|nr:hypothetical protein BSIN_0563 [Burkholderia singularis]